ncbi:hypothetical protein SYNPS1DRAFT_28046 [Syncephalis pseudoplumigaleata]|uniref:Postreplication repair E3 ubiquitin-protein ligase RAD18 n=1 Tax=Syncephalis pseudoplumigaleata TaxID=1712513 RepID=A0A4P9Z1A3_9FUNG|nr:hypothetical protein SYNPS1DRAFT_28046 [Syncephalis pseudoplumigaleata]|eukprot:RKP26257.1 hypothetical protein SYNPS1DRAFT_28046 [Syncephalis pseudoplumigaleata]
MASEDGVQWRDSNLTELDQRLRCPICKEFFKAAVMFTECAHSFCSLCIRRSISAEGVCPVCRHAVLESNLVRNSILDDLAASFSRAAPHLRELTGNSALLDSSIDGPHSAVSQITPIARRTRSTTYDSDFCYDQPSTGRSGSRRSLARIKHLDDHPFARRSLPRRSATSTTSSRSSTKQTEETGECPVCNQTYSMSRLAAHVNRCLEAGPPPSSPASSKSQVVPRYVPPKLSKCVYSVMKDKQLRALLEQHGLPTHGDRATLIRRHKEFALLYNANADLPYPKRPAEVVRQFLREERQHMAGSGNGSTARVQTTKLEAEDIQSHEIRYAEQFTELIEQARSTYAKCKTTPTTMTTTTTQQPEGNDNNSNDNDNADEAMDDVMWSAVFSDPAYDYPSQDPNIA